MISEKEIELKLEEYKGLIISTARRYRIDGMDFEDVFQELCMEFVNVLRKYDETKNASIKTLFIAYAKGWAKKKLEEQGRFKRGTPFRLEDDKVSIGGKILFVQSIIENAEEIEKFEQLQDDLDWYFKNGKDGLLLYERGILKKTLEEIATERGVSFQAISKRHRKAINELKKYLEKRGYDL